MPRLLSNIGLILAVLFFAVSCSRAPKPQAFFDISVRNDTAMVLDDVKIHFGSNLAWRSDHPSISPSERLTFLWDAEPSSHDTAEVQILEHDGKPLRIIKLNVETLKTLPPGKHDVVFSVTALDKAQVFVDGQSR